MSEPPPPFVAEVHRELIRSYPLADKLHCSYMTDLADLSVRHPTFAHERYFDRPVTPVTRRELVIGNRTLFGPAPAELLPPVSDEELFEFVRRDLREFWLPATRKRSNWYADIWVDLSLLTIARAHVTLATGDLITKRAAFDVLPRLGAPLFVAHGDEDEIVPFELGERLFAAAAEPKRFLRVPGAGHNDVLGYPELLDAVAQFANSVVAPGS